MTTHFSPKGDMYPYFFISRRRLMYMKQLKLYNSHEKEQYFDNNRKDFNFLSSSVGALWALYTCKCPVVVYCCCFWIQFNASAVKGQSFRVMATLECFISFLLFSGSKDFPLRVTLSCKCGEEKKRILKKNYNDKVVIKQYKFVGDTSIMVSILCRSLCLALGKTIVSLSASLDPRQNCLGIVCHELSMNCSPNYALLEKLLEISGQMGWLYHTIVNSGGDK